jgi:bacillithiol biosynthesis deacetylase BshB1
MKLDVLAFAAHPDDAEISAGGTIGKLTSQGYKVGIVDLTQGELGSRGSAELRLKESAAASEILGLSVRDNLAMADGFFEDNQNNQLLIIEQIRKYQPEVILCNSITDRHPDHGRGSELVSRASFLSGLAKIETFEEGANQAPWRAKAVYHYIQDYYIEPDFVVDVSEHFDKKMEAISAFSSQFHDPESDQPDTPISGKEFFEFLKARAMQFGRPTGAMYGEGFTTERYVGVDDLMSLH